MTSSAGQTLNWESEGESESLHQRFCALAYKAREAEQPSPIFLIALEDKSGKLGFLVDPDWHAVVLLEDRAYIEALLDDLPERARNEPAILFQQLASLEVGPVVMAQIGKQISDHSLLKEKCSRFVKL